MSQSNDERRAHWETAYTSKQPDQVSWFQARPTLSLDLITRTGSRPDAAFIDVGGGASTLIYHLLDAGYTDLTVVDLAEAALERARTRLGARAIRDRKSVV